MTPNARFNEFITDITPSATTNSRSISAHTSIRESLESDLQYKSNLIRTFLGGPYKRKAAIRPATIGGSTEHPDADIYVVVKGTEWSNSPY